MILRSDAILKHLYNNCKPLIPATAEQYVDLSPARGQKAFVSRFIRQAQFVASPNSQTHFLHFIFSGHYGSGKSSELKLLCRELENMPEGSRLLPIYIDTEEYLNENDTHLIDIFYAIVAELGSVFKAHNLNLESHFFKRFAEDLWDILQTPLALRKVDATFWGLKTEFQPLKHNQEARQALRNKVRPIESELLNEVNTILDQARALLRSQGVYRDIVLVVDNLEKVRKAMGKEDLRESYQALFLDKAPEFNGVLAHAIYTFPLELLRSSMAISWTTTYACEPVVVPMVKVLERDGKSFYEKGFGLLVDLIQKRLKDIPEIGTVDIHDVFTQEALEGIVKYSGGDVRSLLHFIQEAAVNTMELPIEMEAVYQAVSGKVTTFSTTLVHWEKLRALEESSRQSIPNDDMDYQVFLRQGAVFEYMNGSENQSPFEKASPWYAVHPLVRELLKEKPRQAEGTT
jgi:hypothetical protein